MQPAGGVGKRTLTSVHDAGGSCRSPRRTARSAAQAASSGVDAESQSAAEELPAHNEGGEEAVEAKQAAGGPERWSKIGAAPQAAALGKRIWGGTPPEATKAATFAAVSAAVLAAGMQSTETGVQAVRVAEDVRRTSSDVSASIVVQASAEAPGIDRTWASKGAALQAAGCTAVADEAARSASQTARSASHEVDEGGARGATAATAGRLAGKAMEVMFGGADVSTSMVLLRGLRLSR